MTDADKLVRDFHAKVSPDAKESRHTYDERCCHKTVTAHCEGCPYVPVDRCTCFRCLRSLSPNAKGETHD